MKKRLLICVVMCSVIFSACGTSADTSPESTETPIETESVEVSDNEVTEEVVEDGEKHIYDNATSELIAGGDTAQFYSLCTAASSDCTEEALADWYYNYILPNKHRYKYFIILYSDKSYEGVHYSDGLIEKDVEIVQERTYKYHYLYDNTGATTYIPAGDGKTLTVQEYID